MLSRLFGGRKRLTPDDPEAKTLSLPFQDHLTDFNVPLTTVQSIVGIAALAAEGEILQNLFSMTPPPVDSSTSLMLRSELHWFYLHAVDRTAFAEAGPQVRDAIIDEITPHVLDLMITSSFDASHAEPGFDTIGWYHRMLEESLAGFNQAQRDYGSCKTLAHATLQLSSRVAANMPQNSSVPDTLIVEVAQAAMNALSSSNLIAQVQHASRVLTAPSTSS